MYAVLKNITIKQVRWIFLALVVGMTAIYAYSILSKRVTVLMEPQDQAWGQADIGGPFSLQDHQGQTRTHKDFLGKKSIFYFGYAYCPDICPMGLHRLTDALNRMGKKAQAFQPVFVTVDPQRDTPKELKAFLQQFHASFIGLTGSSQDIESIKKAFKVYAVKQGGHGVGENYIMDHSSIFYVMDESGVFLGHFTHATSSEEMEQLLKRWAE